MTGNSFSAPGKCRVEISGWRVDNSFFVERADLHWTNDGEMQVNWHHALAPKSMIFVRLLAPDASNGSVPVACRAQVVSRTDSQEGYVLNLARLHPRVREPHREPMGESLKESPASNGSEGSQKEGMQKGCDTRQGVRELLYEEIFQ